MSDSDTQISTLLEQLARLYGLDTGYRDSGGRWRVAAPGTVMTVLGALGADLGHAAVETDGRMRGATARRERALAAAVGGRERELGGRLLEPVLLAWAGRPASLAVRLPVALGSRPGIGEGGGKARLTIQLENGLTTVVDLDLADYRAGATQRGGGPQTCRIPPAVWTGQAGVARGTEGRARERSELPLGYHRLTVEAGGKVGEAVVIAAPRRCFSPPGSEPGGAAGPRAWGVFAPLYALRSDRDWGAGDLYELRRLADQVHAGGGSAVATLPLLAGYLDDPFEPAPYRPISRLFWNEFYLAPERSPGFDSCEGAQRLWDSSRLQTRLAALRADALVDYKETMALKRAVLEELAACFFARGEDRGNAAFRRYLATHPEAESYAAFCEEVETQRADWRDWEGRRSALGAERVGHGVSASEPDGNSLRRYHLYCQWQMEEQLGALAGSPSSAGLVLDLPVGVHPGGYDTWRWHHLFVHGVSTGAPPDAFFALGQDWDFPPLHPDRAREAGHDYFAACLRHHMRHADMLRIDHIMGLHRLYTIPVGLPATDGVYLKYPAEELYAVLALESERSRTVIVGEDLGTVPLGVRSTMRKRGVLRTWVFQLSLRPRAAIPVGAIPPRSVCGLNTHDMFPFAGFLLGRDIEARVETGQLAAGEAPREASARSRLAARLARFLQPTEGSASLFRPALLHIVRSSSSLVLVNLEDLLQETEPQNLPGTGPERPNWRRKLRAGDAEVRAAIENAARWLRP